MARRPRSIFSPARLPLHGAGSRASTTLGTDPLAGLPTPAMIWAVQLIRAEFKGPELIPFDGDELPLPGV
jgi:hypothetical protein